MKYNLHPLLRFIEKVSFTEDGCWVWSAKVTPNGYGQFAVGSRRDDTVRTVYTHRWSHEFFIGAIPVGYEVDHLCRNRRCANPDHLEAVPHIENVRRGNVAVRELSKTECPQGHPYDEANTRSEERRVGKECRL